MLVDARNIRPGDIIDAPRVTRSGTWDARLTVTTVSTGRDGWTLIVGRWQDGTEGTRTRPGTFLLTVRNRA